MNHKVLFLSDLHFTLNKNDEYRWGLFEQVNQILSNDNQITHIVVSGDITEYKDNHPAELVNRIVSGFAKWQALLHQNTLAGGDVNCGIIVLMGNHDAKDLTTPYFKFLSRVPGLEFLPEARELKINGVDFVFLPHCKNPTEEWKSIDFTDKIVVGHVMVDGAFSEAGYKLESQVNSAIFEKAKKAYSGDIHTPQTCGKLVYIGAPYQIDYNDKYKGRGIILDLNDFTEAIVHFSFLEKFTMDIKTVEEAKAIIDQKIAGKVTEAQVKVRLHINQDNLGEWQDIKAKVFQLVKNAGYTLGTFSLNKEKVVNPLDKALSQKEAKFIDFKNFCKKNGIIDEMSDFGQKIINKEPGYV